MQTETLTKQQIHTHNYYLNNKSRLQSYRKKWWAVHYANNKEYERNRKAVYWRINKYRFSVQKQVYRDKNKEMLHVGQKRWRENNKSKHYATTKLYAQTHPEIIERSRQKSFARLASPFSLKSEQVRGALISWGSVVRTKHSQCVICSQPSKYAHHLIYKKYYPELMLNFGNGIALCQRCHWEVHGWNLRYIKPLEPQIDIRRYCSVLGYRRG